MQPAVFAPLLLVVQAAWLLGAGLAVGLELARRNVIAAYLAVPVAGVVGGLVAYGALWAYFVSDRVGRAYSYLTLAVAAVCVVLLLLRSASRALLFKVDVAAPLALLGLVTMFYAAITFSCTVPGPYHQVAALNDSCHLSGLTGDNIIPQIFGDNIIAGVPKATIWFWQTSARPPLQTGAALMQDPLIHGFGGYVLGYELVTVLLQVLWVPALWALLRALKLSGYRQVAVLTMGMCTGFFFFNSVFVWPKLVAAAMTLTALILLFFAKRSWWTWTLAGLAAGTGLLAHSGVAFTLIPMGILLLMRRYRPQLRYLALTAVAGVLTLVPWELYQRSYDPPGDQLLKYHFAGVWEPFDGVTKPQPLGHVVVKAYTDPPLSTILHNKWMNVASYVGYPGTGLHIAGGGWWGHVRATEFSFVIWGLGLFNLALVLLLLPAVRRRLGPAMDVSRLRLMFAIVGLNLVLETLVEYGSGLTTPAIFQGSYALMMLLFGGLGAVLTVLPKPAVNVLVALNAAYFAVVWIGLVWWPDHHFHRSFALLSALSGVALLATLWLAARSLTSAPRADRSWGPVKLPKHRLPARQPSIEASPVN
jgi:hypothetical protein